MTFLDYLYPEGSAQMTGSAVKVAQAAKDAEAEGALPGRLELILQEQMNESSRLYCEGVHATAMSITQALLSMRPEAVVALANQLAVVSANRLAQPAETIQ